MIEYRLENGKLAKVKPEHVQQFLEKHPNATPVSGNQESPAEGAPIGQESAVPNQEASQSQNNTDSNLEVGSLESLSKNVGYTYKELEGTNSKLEKLKSAMGDAQAFNNEALYNSLSEEYNNTISVNEENRIKYKNVAKQYKALYRAEEAKKVEEDEKATEEEANKLGHGFLSPLIHLTRGVTSFAQGLGSYTEGIETGIMEWWDEADLGFLKEPGEEWTPEKRKKARLAVKAERLVMAAAGSGPAVGSSMLFEPAMMALDAEIPEFDTNITQDFSNGDYLKAAHRTVDGLFASAPSFIAAMIPGGLALLAASTAGNKYEEEVLANPDMDTGTLLVNATGSGLIEAGFEYVTRGLLKKTGLIQTGSVAAAKEYLEYSSKNILKKFGLGGWSMVKEGSSEAATELTSALWDAIPKDKGGLGKEMKYDDVFYRMSDAFIIGSFSGGVFESVGAMSSGNSKKNAEAVLMSEELKGIVSISNKKISELTSDLDEATPEEKELIQEQIKAEAEKIKSIHGRNSKILSTLEGKALQDYADNVDKINRVKKAHKEAKTDTGRELALNKYNQLTEANSGILKESIQSYTEKSVSNMQTMASKLSESGGPSGTITTKTATEIEAMDMGFDKDDDGNIVLDKDGNKVKKSTLASKQYGTIIQQSDGSYEIIINKDVPAIGVAGHEFFHAILFNTLGKDPEVAKSLQEALDGHVNSLSGNQTAMRERLDESYEGSEDLSEETITIMSESILNGSLEYDEGFFTKIGDILRRFLQGKGIPGQDIKLDTGKDVFNFVKDFVNSIETGKVNKAITKVGAEGAKGKLVDKGKAKTEAKAKANAKPKSKPDADVKFSKDKLSPLEQINKLIPEGFDKPFKDLTRREQMNIIDPIFIETLDNGVISNYVKSRSTSPEEYNKAIEGVRDRLVNFNPKAKRKTGSKMPITFGEFVFANTRFGKLDAKKELYEESELRSRQGSIDAPEAAQVSDSDSNVEDFDSINLTEDHVQETSKFRRELNLGQDMVDKMIDTIVKTFGTNLPNIHTKQFKQALAKAFKTELKITMQNFMGKSKDYDAFLEEYMPIVFNRLPLDVLVAMERLVHSDKMLAKYPNAKKIFTTSYRETSAIKVDELIAQDRLPKDTNRTSGPQVHTKLEYPGIKKIMAFYRGNSKIIDKETGEEVKISMLGELGYEVGASSFGPRKDVLAERIITEVTFDGVAETIQKESVRGKIEGLNIAGIDNLENDLAIIAKQISRNPSVKFSKKGNIAKDFYISIIDGGMTENSIIVAANKHYPDSNKSALNKIVKQTLKKVGIVVERNEVLQGKLKEISGKTKVEALLEIDVQDNFKKGIKNALRGLLEAEGNGKAIDPGTLANTVKGLNAQRNHLVDVVSSMVETEGLVKGVEVIISHTQAMYAGAGKAGDGGLMPHKPGGQIIPTPNWNGDNGLKWKVYTQADVNAGIVPKGKKIGDFKLDSKGRKISRDNRQQATNGVEDFVALINQGLPKGAVLTNPSKGKFILTDTKTGVETNLNTSLHGESSASLFSDIKRKGVKQTFKDRKQTSLDARKVTKVVLDLAWSKINKGDMTAGDFGLLVMSIGSSMNSPLRRSAYADRIPSNYKQLIAKYGPKAVGKLFQYEHGTPKEAVATKIIQSYLDTGKMSDKVWDNYTVQVIHKALDRIIDASGHKYTERIDGQPRAFNAQTMALAVDLSGKDFNELAPLESLDPSDTEVMGKNWLEVVDLLRNKVELSPNVLSRVGKGARTMKWSKDTVTKGMSTFDFDETLIIDGENFVVATKDGKTIKIRSEEWPTKGPDLASQDYNFDFSDFAKVRGGKEGPLLQKMKNQVKKYGAENVFVLTARQQDAAGPIHEWLRSQGINVPLENITGLGKSEGSAKGEWMLQKFAEGYNDMYFVDDAMSNVKAVKDVLDALDIKSKVVQAKIKFSKSASVDFNKMLEKSKGIGADVEVSSAAAKIRGAKKGRFDFFVPPSAEDFKGLIYSFLGKGKQGEADLLWFKDNLFDPFAKGIREMDSIKQTMTEEYKAIKKRFPTTVKGLNKNIAGTDFTLDNAIRIYLWKEAGFEIPGLSEREANTLWRAVRSSPNNEAFAIALSAISRSVDGYTKPSEFWVAETIASDLSNIVNKVNREQYLSEWIENKNIVFSKENLNKIESIYGTNFREALENILFRMESGSNRPSGQDKVVNRFLNWINGAVGAVMFFNTRSAVLQTLSTVNFLNFKENNIFAAAKAFANQKQFWSDFAMIYNSDMLKQRRAGLKIDVSASELTEAFSKGKSRPEAIIAYLLQIGFTPTQIADSFAISMGGSTYYRNMLNKYMKDGMSKADAEAKAFLDFQEIAEETQQSSRPDMISQQQSGTLGRIILAWANTPMQMTRLTKKALSDLVNGRGDIKSNVSKILYYGMIQNFIFGSLQTGLAFLAFGDEEDEEKTQTKEIRVANGMLDTLLRGTGVYGAAVSTVKNVIMQLHEEFGKGFGKRDWSRISQKIFDLSPPLGTKHRKIMNAIKTYDYNKDVIKKMGPGINNPAWDIFGNVVEAVTNAPVARLISKLDNVRLLLTGNMDMWQRTAILLGWSTWSVGVEDQELVDVKAEVKADRKAASKERSKQKKTDSKKSKTNIKTVRCSGTRSSGGRCNIQVETNAKSAKCMYHKEFKEGSDTDGDGKKEYRCKSKTGSGKRCRNKTENKNKRCYAHQ